MINGVLASNSKLNTGIYWFGKNDARRKAERGIKNPYFDPTKPTVIYTHGWQRGTIEGGKDAISFLYYDPVTNTTIDTTTAWLDGGWNVGAFLWDQFADEDFVGHAEGKIWSVDGPGKMRWRNSAGQLQYVDTFDQSIADVYFASYLDAMADYQGDNIRLVGHSLGTQLTAALAGKVNDAIEKQSIDAKYLPKRVALLDPFWLTSFTEATRPGKRVHDIVAATKMKMAWEMIKTSGVLTVPILGSLLVDQNNELTDLIGEVVLSPDFANAADPLNTLVNRHLAAITIYFVSKGITAAGGSCCLGGDCTAAPLAASSDDLVRRFMKRAKSCRQQRPMKSPADLDIPELMSAESYHNPIDARPVIEVNAQDVDAASAVKAADPAADAPDDAPTTDPSDAAGAQTDRGGRGEPSRAR